MSLSQEVSFELRSERGKRGSTFDAIWRKFQIRGPAGRKPQEAASVILRRGSAKRWAVKNRNGRVGA